jgi:hypothetical protein
MTAWHYSINYGPDGEANYANVHAADGQFVGNLRTHHAIAICNAFAVCEKLATTPSSPVSAPSPAGGVREAVLTALRQAASGGATGLADHEIDEIANDLLAALSNAPGQEAES